MSCCTPGREPGTATAVTRPRPADHARVAVIPLPGGRFLMGSDDGYPDDGEGPVREVSVRPFAIAATAVTTAQFAEFVAATGYATDAERFGFSYVFGQFLPADLGHRSPPVPGVPWWRAVAGATWAAPEGPGSTTEGREDHPVTHVSWSDAQVFCRWAKVRLPTEAEWEYAARGGLEGRTYPWGDELTPGGAHRCNIWQGRFPDHNTEADGYAGTAPVDAFEPNGFGLYNVAGNVWEWCADWFTPGHSTVMRGGSYLCHESYCNRYRVAARSSNTPDSSTGNIGFRVAADL
ncbi:formylglycine-generating enzyme family protein [Actinokineospora soli]|uniref:Formylglycine-generating enzyme family protein n=1 Tax=Actinokineospora soli TaxID=1048753 RepID=A0ABW2TK79_9PSEU